MAHSAGASGTAQPWLICGEGFVALRIIVRPGVSRRGVVRVDARGLVVALNSPPEKGKANDELVEYLARTFKIPRAAVTIVRGAASRHKTVRIATNNPRVVAAAFEALADGRNVSRVV
jgi:uncharacterized protein